ncbi:MAG: NADH-quinone oxidoreductase subunit J [Phycisphaerae bacterium]|nr:NADH-quinone oxidoreductase subunit J [Phycisphaerae bacterium]
MKIGLRYISAAILMLVCVGAPAMAGGSAPARDAVVTRIESGGALEATMFYSFAAVGLISAIGVVISRNIVRTAVCLLFTLGAMAGFYFLLAANFVGAVQLIVYAGGTLVLIIFGVMLTGRSMAARFRAPWYEVVAGVVICGVLLVGLVTVLTQAPWDRTAEAMEQGPTIDQVGTELLTTYLVPFEVVSVLLLVAMIGAAYLARPERR